jgi:hypothetical protein
VVGQQLAVSVSVASLMLTTVHTNRDEQTRMRRGQGDLPIPPYIPLVDKAIWL